MIWFSCNARMIWWDNTAKCSLSVPPSKGKKVVICHAGSSEGFVPNAVLLCGKQLSESYADYHDMNAEIFKRWFANTLITNLPKDRKVVFMMVNAKYHSRLVDKSPTMNMRKNDMISYMIEHRIEIPSPLTVKPVLLQKIHVANIPK